jgi:hypothetical protein
MALLTFTQHPIFRPSLHHNGIPEGETIVMQAGAEYGVLGKSQ